MADPRCRVEGIALDGADADLSDTVAHAVEAVPRRRRRDDNALRDAARHSVQRTLRRLAAKRPDIGVELIRLP